MIAGYRITDVHVHVQPWEMLLPQARATMEAGRADLDLYRSIAGSPSALLRHMDREGIDRAAVINYVSPDLMGFPDEVNDWAAAYCAQAPDRLAAFGSVHPRFSRDPAGDARRLLDLGIRGFKVHPPHQDVAVNAYRRGGPGEGLGAVYEVAEQAGVPVMIHTGTSVFPGARNVHGDPLPADDVAVDFPRLTLILAHAGRPLWSATAFFLARRHPNVLLDLSGIPPRKLLQDLPRLPEIADRCLWGSDWPGPGVPGLGHNATQFLELPLPDGIKRAVLDGNAATRLAGLFG